MVAGKKRPLAKRAADKRVVLAASTDRLWGELRGGDLVVVDSSPLIYMLDGRPEFATPFRGLFELHDQGLIQIAISTIAVAEVLAGPLKHGQQVLARRYERALGAFDIVPVTQQLAVTAANVRATFGLKLPDALQAATALEIGAVALVTHDRDFSRLEGIRVVLGG